MVKNTDPEGSEPLESSFESAQPGFFSRLVIRVRSAFSRRTPSIPADNIQLPVSTSVPVTAGIDTGAGVNDKSVQASNSTIPKHTKRGLFTEKHRLKMTGFNTKKSRVNRSIHKGLISEFSRLASTYENVDGIKDDPRLKFLSWCRGARYDDFINELQKTFVKETIFNQDLLIEIIDGKSIPAGIKFLDILAVRSGPLYLSAGNENKGRDVYEDDPDLYQAKLEMACQKIKLSLNKYAEFRAENERQEKFELNKSSVEILQKMACELNNNSLFFLLNAKDFENAYAKFKERLCKNPPLTAEEHEKIDWFFRGAIANTQKFLLPQLARKLSDFDLVMENEERLISALKKIITGLDPAISDSAIRRFAQSFWQLGVKLDMDILTELSKDETLAYTDLYVAKHPVLCAGDKPLPQTHTLITSTQNIIRKIIPQSLVEENVNPVQIDTSYGLGISYNGPELISHPTDSSTRWSHHIFREAEAKVTQMITDKDPFIYSLIEENARLRKINGEADMHSFMSATDQIKNEQIKHCIERLGYGAEDVKRICQHNGLFEHGDVICDTSSYFAKYINNDNLFASYLHQIQDIIQKMPVSTDTKNYHINKIQLLLSDYNQKGLSISSQMEYIVEYLNDELKDAEAIKLVNGCYMHYYQGLLFYDNLSLFEEAGKKWSQCQIFSPLHKTEKYYGNMFDIAQAVVPSMIEIERKSKNEAHTTHRTSVIDDESKPYRSIDKSFENVRLKAQIQILKLCFRLDYVRFYLHREYLLSDPAVTALHKNMNPYASAVIADIDKRTYLKRHLNEMIAHPKEYSEERILAMNEVLKRHEEIVASQLKYFNENYRQLIELAYDMNEPDILEWDEDFDSKMISRSLAVTNPDFSDDFVVGMPRYNSAAPEINANYIKEKCPDLVNMLRLYVQPNKSSAEKSDAKEPVDELLEKMVADFKKRIVENYQFRDVFELRLAKKDRTKIKFPISTPEHSMRTGKLYPVGKRLQVKNRGRSNSDPISNLPSWNSKLQGLGSSHKKIDIEKKEENPEEKPKSTHKPGSDHSNKP